jgi:hypothetical protein
MIIDDAFEAFFERGRTEVNQNPTRRGYRP